MSIKKLNELMLMRYLYRGGKATRASLDAVTFSNQSLNVLAPTEIV